MARAVYAPAGFVASTDTTVTLSLPNDAHRRKCEQQRPTVEAALSGHIGSAVTVELVIDREEGAESGMSDASASGGSSAPGGPATGERGATDDERPRPPAGGPTSGAVGGAPAAPAEELPDDDDVDLDDLVDAPPDTARTPIDRLAEAFPGSQLIDESA
jgi:DNA polymerase-3 subunit gamma/tau